MKEKSNLKRPLIVDLDGTLIKSDMLFESASSLIVRHPLNFICLLSELRKGKSQLKSKIANICPIDAAVLPYNSDVLDLIKKQKALGKKIILATASHYALAEAVAKHLNLFDEVLATKGDINLISEAKRDVLVARFGEKGFDYVGNSFADIPVWRSADKAYVVSSSQKLIEKVQQMGNLAQVISNGKPALFHTLLKAMRPHQWVKNLLIFIAPLAAHHFYNLSASVNSIIAFVVFCLAASSVYLLNDLIDVADDRYHQHKRFRPFASGNLSLLVGWILWPVLLIGAFTISLLTLPSDFCAVLAAYVVITMAYSLRLKQIAILDVLTLTILYTLRIIAGAKAVTIPLSFWLLAFSIFFFLSLAFIKRFSELKAARQAGRATQIKGRGYVHGDLEMISSMGVSSGYLAVLVLALYIQDYHIVALYAAPKYIWLACPLLLYWISRAWLIADRGHMHDDPIIFAIKDRISWLVVFAMIAVFILAVLG